LCEFVQIVGEESVHLRYVEASLSVIIQ